MDKPVASYAEFGDSGGIGRVKAERSISPLASSSPRHFFFSSLPPSSKTATSQPAGLDLFLAIPVSLQQRTVSLTRVSAAFSAGRACADHCYWGLKEADPW